MVTHLQQPVDRAFIVAGLPSFDTLSTIAERIAPTTITSMSPLPSPRRMPLFSHSRPAAWIEWEREDVTKRVEADLLSPGGTSDDIQHCAVSASPPERKHRRVPGDKALAQGHMLVVSKAR
jgi:hypothetical protein